MLSSSMSSVFDNGLLAVVIANAVVLVVAAVAKARAPLPFATSLRAAGVAGGHRIVRGVVVVEVAVATAAMLGGWAGLAAIAALDMVMAAFLVRLQRRAAGASCGCFGASSAPSNTMHVVVNLVCAVAAGTFAVRQASGNVVQRAVDAANEVGGWPGAVAWIVGAGLAAYLLFVVMTLPFGARATREVA